MAGEVVEPPVRKRLSGDGALVVDDRTRKFDMLKLPQELRDVIYHFWLEARPSVIDSTEEGGGGDSQKRAKGKGKKTVNMTTKTVETKNFVHECRGFSVPFRSYLNYHEAEDDESKPATRRTKSTLEVGPSPCKLFNCFGSQVRQKAMQPIPRDHSLFDHNAKKCMQALADWVKVVPLSVLVSIRAVQLLVNCSVEAEGTSPQWLLGLPHMGSGVNSCAADQRTSMSRSMIA